MTHLFIYNRQRIEMNKGITMFRQILRKIPHKIIVERYRFFTSNSAAHPSSNPQLKENNLIINTANYLYHSLNGFDLFKLVSILKHGILSKESAELRGIKISSHGRFENGANRVSVSTREDKVLFPGSYYAGDHLSVIIEPKGLSVIKPISDNCPLHERQVHGQISPQNIVGIMVPEVYFTKALREFQVFNVRNKDILKISINNMDNFMQEHFNISMLSNPTILKYYDEAMMLKRNTLREYFNYEQKVKQLNTNLNASVMEFIENQHKLKLAKTDITAIDIIQHHTKDKYPLFKVSEGYIKPMKDPLDNYPSDIKNNL